MSSWPASRSLDPILEQTLVEHVPANDIRRLGNCTFLVYAAADPENVRNWLTGKLGGRENVLVVEFERWSSQGEGVDVPWLLRRGH